jgi:CRP/FNR family transcriptional regulator, cyclic AMP receptor protein
VSEHFRAPLLMLDPSLGRLLTPGRRDEARSALPVRVARLRKGKLDPARAAAAPLGLLVIDGVVTRDVLIRGQATTELLGPGDVLRPWMTEPDPLLRRAVRWCVVDGAHAALLDREFVWQLSRWPEVNAVLMERLAERSDRLATTQAILSMTGVDRRVLAFLWHSAERWGRMTAEGVHVPLALSHRMLGQLVGARRPTVTAAVRTLAETGELTRRADGTWLLPAVGVLPELYAGSVTTDQRWPSGSAKVPV